MAKHESIEHLKSLLSRDEIIEPGSSLYTTESTCWASQHDRHPTIIVRPKTVESLAKALAYLNTTDLEIDARSQGYGSASAKDVLISTSAFDQFELDLEQKVLTLGAGQAWKTYYEKMDQIAPDWTVVACRTPCIGVAGSVLHGGYSWLSGEYGCASDPQNMLDAQVVKLNGEIVWASTEPDLLWALRGGGGGWGVVTAFKFRVRPAPKDIFCGPILLPRSAVSDVAKGIAEFDARSKDPRVSLFIYVMPKESLPFIGMTEDSEDDKLVVHAYDSRGEAHARSDDGFNWALKIPGAIDMTKVMNMKEVASMQGALESAKGQNTSLWWPMAAAHLTEDYVLKAFDWYDKVKSQKGSISKNIYLLYELRSTTTDTIAAGETAYPRIPGMRHVLLLGTGTAKDAPPEELETAEKVLREGPGMILGEGVKHNVVANGIEHFHNMRDVYGEHYEKLQKIKRIYDPKNKLRGPISPFDGPRYGER